MVRMCSVDVDGGEGNGVSCDLWDVRVSENELINKFTLSLNYSSRPDVLSQKFHLDLFGRIYCLFEQVGSLWMDGKGINDV